MSRTIDIEGLKSILEPHLVVLKDFDRLRNTPFRLNAFNGVYAPAKTGKTYFTLEQLDSLDPLRYKIAWLDGDRNSELKGKFPNILHFPLLNTASAFDTLLEQKERYDNYIFVIDSFKDFTFGHDTDGNKGSQEVFERYQQLLNNGMTPVL